MQRATLRKNERMTSQLLMDQLFRGTASSSVMVYPLRCVYTVVPRHGDDAAAQLLCTVSKRHFKHAVQRNRVKRQIREAYRLQKDLLPEIGDDSQLLIAFIWQSDRLYPSSRVHTAVAKALHKIRLC